jgi:chemotaxis response regulator CheB
LVDLEALHRGTTQITVAATARQGRRETIAIPVVVLEARDDMEVVGEAADGHEAVALAKQHRPDVILMASACPASTVPTPLARSHPIPTSPWFAW